MVLSATLLQVAVASNGCFIRNLPHFYKDFPTYFLTFIPIAQKVFALYCMFPMKNNVSSYLFVFKVLCFKGYVKMNHCVTKETFAPSEDTDQPGHPPSLIRVFPVRRKKAKALSYQLRAQFRLRSDLADA